MPPREFEPLTMSPESSQLRGSAPQFDLFQIFEPPPSFQRATASKSDTIAALADQTTPTPSKDVIAAAADQTTPTLSKDVIAAPTDQTKPTAPETESQIQTLLWMNLDKILDQVPPGTTITSNQFAKDFGPEAAEQLEKAGVTSIDNTAKPGQKPHFVIDFNQPGAVQTNGGELDHANSVSFDYSKSPNGEVDLTNVHGLTAKAAHGVKSMGTATVDSVEIVHDDSNGNVKLTGDAHWMFFHGARTYEFGPDGIPIQPTVAA